jgi:DNA-binding transcriptional LysR family regulator
MDVRYLKTFVALAETRNVTRTAERLDYAPSSVAAHVHALEGEVGVPLIERAGRGIDLTAAGRTFLGHAKRMVDAERNAIADLRAGAIPAGTLTIGSAASLAAFVLPRILERLHAHRPGLSVSTRQGLCDDHIAAVRRGELDLAFSVEARAQLERLRDGTTATEVFCTVPIVAAAAPSHRLARLERVEPSDFAGETLVVCEPGCSYREAFAAVLDDAGVRAGALLDFDNLDAIRRCAIDGLGVAIVPRYVVADAVDAGTLVELPIRAPGDFVIAATWLPAARSAAVQDVLAAARTALAQPALATAG